MRSTFLPIIEMPTLKCLPLHVGTNPEARVAELKGLGHIAVIIMKFGDHLGLIRTVLVDYFATTYSSQKLAFIVDMTPVYLRKLRQHILQGKKYSFRFTWPGDFSYVMQGVTAHIRPKPQNFITEYLSVHICYSDTVPGC